MAMDTLFDLPYGPFVIFFIRVIDVSMAVVRMILAVRGRRGLAAVIGFFELLLWLMAAGNALKHLDSWMHVVGYAGGFAVGNYTGVWIEQRLALGLNSVRAVLRFDGSDIAQKLREAGFAVTVMAGTGMGGSLEILHLIVPRSKVEGLLRRLHELAPDAFISVEEVRSTYGGYIRPGGRKTPSIVS